MHAYHFSFFESLPEDGARRLRSVEFPASVEPYIPAIGDRVTLHLNDTYMTCLVVRRDAGWVLRDDQTISALTFFVIIEGKTPAVHVRS